MKLYMFVIKEEKGRGDAEIVQSDISFLINSSGLPRQSPPVSSNSSIRLLQTFSQRPKHTHACTHYPTWIHRIRKFRSHLHKLQQGCLLGRRYK